jgi:hypothetical protein
MWWLPAAGDAAAGLLPGLSPRDLDLLPPPARGDGSDGEGDGNGGGSGAGAAGAGAAQLLALAAAQRMNTDVRKVGLLLSEGFLRGVGGGLRRALKGFCEAIRETTPPQHV